MSKLEHALSIATESETKVLQLLALSLSPYSPRPRLHPVSRGGRVLVLGVVGASRRGWRCLVGSSIRTNAHLRQVFTPSIQQLLHQIQPTLSSTLPSQLPDPVSCFNFHRAILPTVATAATKSPSCLEDSWVVHDANVHLMLHACLSCGSLVDGQHHNNWLNDLSVGYNKLGQRTERVKFLRAMSYIIKNRVSLDYKERLYFVILQ